ncbi:hypothetical protein FGO68_gene1364 [Halteria grandinella]|uniref:Uncharacterized protein n=1 Tax=Halteria grandinella TaxID=5974 RepID=A0A8J8NUR4_HALGN|nr:hypothetical protein FGO68_gene1364 [Halteria grandinella]
MKSQLSLISQLQDLIRFWINRDVLFNINGEQIVKQDIDGCFNIYPKSFSQVQLKAFLHNITPKPQNPKTPKPHSIQQIKIQIDKYTQNQNEQAQVGRSRRQAGATDHVISHWQDAHGYPENAPAPHDVQQPLSKERGQDRYASIQRSL